MGFFTEKELIMAERGHKIPKNVYRVNTPAYISFSGGRTSAYMLYQILEEYNFKMPDDLHILFANTGKEMEETLKFVREIERQWPVRIRWLEYYRVPGAPIIRPGTEHYKYPEVGCHGVREVDYNTASRKGEPYEAFIDVKAEWRMKVKDEDPILPNVANRWCSFGLKIAPMDQWMKEDCGYESFDCVVGLRADEPSRVKKLHKNNTQVKEFVTPMYDACVVIDDVIDFWKNHPFDLALEHHPKLGTYKGNCDLCFLKSGKKIAQIIEEHPESLDWWVEMEEKTGATFARNRPSFKQIKEHRELLISLKTLDDEADSCACTL